MDKGKARGTVQTHAEKRLVERLTVFINEINEKSGGAPRILNIGAGKQTVIEDLLMANGCDFVCDRVDVEDCRVDHPYVGSCWECSVESMEPVGSEIYVAAFANYVLEHINNHERASSEIYRVLAPAGIFVATVPNPAAPQFMLARHTPLWFHRKIRGAESWETHYEYETVEELVNKFESAGFKRREIAYYAFTQNYLARYAVGRIMTRLYDALISKVGIARLMGNVCIEFEKSSDGNSG